MAFPTENTGRKRRWVLALGLLLAAGVGGGLAASVAVPAAPEVPGANYPTHFKSGGERSLVILGEIRDTVKQIDVRLQRIEQAVLTAANKEPDLQHARPGGVR